MWSSSLSPDVLGDRTCQLSSAGRWRGEGGGGGGLARGPRRGASRRRASSGFGCRPGRESTLRRPKVLIGRRAWAFVKFKTTERDPFNNTTFLIIGTFPTKASG